MTHQVDSFIHFNVDSKDFNVKVIYLHITNITW